MNTEGLPHAGYRSHPSPTSRLKLPHLHACSAQLVKFLHVASPYVMRHRGRIFVIVVPGEVGPRTGLALCGVECGCFIRGPSRAHKRFSPAASLTPKLTCPPVLAPHRAPSPAPSPSPTTPYHYHTKNTRQVAYEPRQLQPLLEDLLLLHGLGIRLVIVVGGKPWIDDHLRAAGREPRFEGAYRVTDAAAMAGALHASAVTYTTIAGHMSRVGAEIPRGKGGQGEDPVWPCRGLPPRRGPALVPRRQRRCQPRCPHTSAC